MLLLTHTSILKLNYQFNLSNSQIILFLLPKYSFKKKKKKLNFINDYTQVGNGNKKSPTITLYTYHLSKIFELLEKQND